MAVADSTEDQRAWEARRRPRAGAVAILGGLFVLASALAGNFIFRDAPHSGFLEALGRAAAPGPVGTTPSGLVPGYAFYDAHRAAVLALSLVTVLGLLAVAYVMTFLAAAVRARRPELPRMAIYLPLVGALLQAVAAVLGTIARTSSVSSFLAGPRTVDAASAVSSSSLLVTSALIGYVGQFALAAGFVLVSVNAMRVGLLTRFMGVLGAIIGVLQVIPIGPLPVVETFWLVALGLLCLDRWPGGGVPPAWRTGRAEPWPSQAEAAEQRRAAAQARRGGGRRTAEPEAPAAAEAAGAVPAGQARRKRKRRR